MTKSNFTVTSLTEAPKQERDQRMRKYVLTMSIRFICILAIPFVSGWWMLLCAVGAIFLPYFAVVIANVKSSKTTEDALEHVVLELTGAESASRSQSQDERATLIIASDEDIRVVTKSDDQAGSE